MCTQACAADVCNLTPRKAGRTCPASSQAQQQATHTQAIDGERASEHQTHAASHQVTHLLDISCARTCSCGGFCSTPSPPSPSSPPAACTPTTGKSHKDRQPERCCAYRFGQDHNFLPEIQVRQSSAACPSTCTTDAVLPAGCRRRTCLVH